MPGESKGAADGRRVLGDFEGIIIADAATTHESLSSLKVRFAHCWAHVIRKARDLEVADPLRAAHVVKQIQQLYNIDDEAGDDEEKRLELRRTKSRKVVDELYEWRLEQRPLSASPTAGLLGYLDNHRLGLKRFLENARIPLDNNQSERGYCRVAVGRRSFFGSRSKRGTEVAALFYSLAETARRVGLEPRAYFARALASALAGKTVPLPHELLTLAQSSPGPTQTSWQSRGTGRGATNGAVHSDGAVSVVTTARSTLFRKGINEGEIDRRSTVDLLRHGKWSYRNDYGQSATYRRKSV